MRKILKSRFIIATLIAGFVALAGCSSGGSTSSSGLGLDVSGQWRGQLTERRTGRNAGTVSLLIQSSSNANNLNPLSVGEQVVFGSLAYENFSTEVCPIGSIVGTIEGTVSGNELVAHVEGDDYTFTISGVMTDTRLSGDWSVYFEYEILVVDEDGNEDEVEANCTNFGTWSATKTGT